MKPTPLEEASSSKPRSPPRRPCKAKNSHCLYPLHHHKITHIITAHSIQNPIQSTTSYTNIHIYKHTWVYINREKKRKSESIQREQRAEKRVEERERWRCLCLSLKWKDRNRGALERKWKGVVGFSGFRRFVIVASMFS